MDHARFWSLIDAAGGDARALVRSLANLRGEEIVGFDAWFWAYYMGIARQDLWAAVYAINGGCGDDSFDYFRGWLIGRGEAAVLAAIRDPESLADTVTRSSRDEYMLGAARRAYAQAATGEMPDSRTVEIPGRAEWPADRIASGVKWTDDFYAKQYPALYARFIKPHATPKLEGHITHERFWELVESSANLAQLSDEELDGYDRWMSAYNQALIRNDMRAATRVLVGNDSVEAAFEFRGWLIARGRAVVEGAMRDIDSIPTDRAASKLAIIITLPRTTFEHRGIFRPALDADEREVIPNGPDGWLPDWTEQPPFAVGLLRSRLPKLTANKTDEQLTGSVDTSTLAEYERRKRAEELRDRAKATAKGGHAAAAIPLFDDSLRLWTNAETLGARGRAHLTLGNRAAALADFDAALATGPHAMQLRWARAKLRDAMGDRAGALEDARMLASQMPEAKAWLSVVDAKVEMPDVLAPLNAKRVRHAKFGEGNVVSVDGDKLVIDFPTAGRKTLIAKFVEVLE